MTKKLLSPEECKSHILDIMVEIDRICNENEISYYMAYGTLLGAVRHKGFIPWDDDIDIIMMREDYNKLIKILKSNNNPSWLGVIDGDTPGYYYTFAKAVDNRTIAKHDDTHVEAGLWVDIFPWDAIPDDEIKRQRYLKSCHRQRNLILAMSSNFDQMVFSKKTVGKFILSLFATIVGRNRIYRYSNAFNQRYTGTKYISCLTTPYTGRESFLKEDMVQSVKIEFEGQMFNAPQNWHLFLSQIYGDYMKLPPTEKRRTHNITAWEK